MADNKVGPKVTVIEMSGKWPIYESFLYSKWKSTWLKQKYWIQCMAHIPLCLQHIRDQWFRFRLQHSLFMINLSVSGKWIIWDNLMEETGVLDYPNLGWGHLPSEAKASKPWNIYTFFWIQWVRKPQNQSFFFWFGPFPVMTSSRLIRLQRPLPPPRDTIWQNENRTL